MVDTFHYSIGGDPTNPADIFFREFTLSANTTLVWPFAAQDSSDVAARLMLVNVSIPSLQLLMPPANQAPVGYTAVIANLGSVAFTVYDNLGGVITTLNAGDVKYIAIRTAADTAGTWYVITFGSGTSAVNASALAGFGLKAIASTLNTDVPLVTISDGQTLGVGDRAGGHVWTSGSGTINFDACATLLNGWWTAIKNLGSGTLTLDPNLGELIDNQSTLTLNIGDSCLVFCTGTYLYSIGIGRITTTADSRLSLSVAGSTNVTLTAAQAANDVLNFTGLLTGSINVICPTTVKNYFISNNTTGAFSLTFKTSAGTGVVVTQGSAKIVTCDGTNVISAQSTSSGTVTSIVAGTGLNGGTISTTGTISLANTGVTAGSYGDVTHFTSFTVNGQGQLSAAAQTALNSNHFFTAPSASTGSANAQVITTVNGNCTLVAPNTIMFIPGFTNIGPMQVNVDGTGLTSVVRIYSAGTEGALLGNEVQLNYPCIMTYYNSVWTLLNPLIGIGNAHNFNYDATGNLVFGTAPVLPATSVLTNGVTATTQSGANNTTLVATTAQVQAAIAAATSGIRIVTPLGIGSYAYGFRTSHSYTPGQTEAGANITTENAGGTHTGDTLSGTWQAMYSTGASGSGLEWQRIL